MGCCGKKKSDAKTPIVDDNCIGCWACAAICGEVFEINDEGRAVVTQWVDLNSTDCIDDAIAACPVSSISYK